MAEKKAKTDVKPAAKATEKPNSKPVPKTSAKTSQKPAAKPAEKSVATPVATSVATPAGETSQFFTYKGLPLVRNKDTIYYGNMWDTHVVMLQITEKTKVNGLDIAGKVKIYQMATDEKLNPIEAIVKTSEKKSLYDALDIAYIWLSRKAG